jgi:hypothetical protein
MTYYPPPSHFYRYYDWVPYPFYFCRNYFSGFFILHDFHRAHKFDRRFHSKHKQFGFHGRFKRKFISNHHVKQEIERTQILRPGGGQRKGKIHDRRFSRERLDLRHPSQRSGREAFMRSTPNFRRNSSDSFRTSESYRRGKSESALRTFGPKDRGAGAGGSFRSYQPQSRGFSGYRGGMSHGRR